MMIGKASLSLALPVVVLATACSPKVSDTGYIGTWTRGTAISGSMISIAKTGEQYRFHWELRSVDGKWRVNCDANAHCEEFYEGKKTTDFRFTTRIDPASGHLIVEGARRTFDKHGQVTAEGTDVDELVIEKGGLELVAHTIERNGTRMPKGEGPQRHYAKLSDSVMEPGT